MSTSLTTQALLSTLQWRYATKAFDPEKKIPGDVMAALEDSIVLTPSSYGLQPYKALVITDRSLRESLVPHAWGQRQVADCSHLVVFAIRKTFQESNVDAFIDRIVEVRGVGRDSLQFYRDMMVGDIVNGPRSREYVSWAKCQTYIALGQLMLSAAALGIDTCPMEGFVPAKFDEILGLDALGLTVSVACPLGYRSVDDKYATLPKVRFAKDDLILHR